MQADARTNLQFSNSTQAVTKTPTLPVSKSKLSEIKRTNVAARSKISIPKSPLTHGAKIAGVVQSISGNTVNLQFTYSVPDSFRSGSAMDMSRYLIDVQVINIDTIMQDWQIFQDASTSMGYIHEGTYLGDAYMNNADGSSTYMSAYETSDGMDHYYFKSSDGTTWETNSRNDVDADGVTNSNDNNNTDGPAEGRGDARDNNGNGNTTDPGDDHDGDGVNNEDDAYPNDPERSSNDEDDEDDDDDGKDEGDEGDDIIYESEGGTYIFNELLAQIMNEIANQQNTESLLQSIDISEMKNQYLDTLTVNINENLAGVTDYSTVLEKFGGIGLPGGLGTQDPQDDGGSTGGTPDAGEGIPTGGPDAPNLVQDLSLATYFKVQVTNAQRF